MSDIRENTEKVVFGGGDRWNMYEKTETFSADFRK